MRYDHSSFRTYFSKIHLIGILPSFSWSPKWTISERFRNKTSSYMLSPL